ncbi:MAG: hypothetical protein H7X95_11255 [Deltaproteobacteria bacterium]|nr:hypothetical protein [Deltaproteobacteria bacterium]
MSTAARARPPGLGLGPAFGLGLVLSVASSLLHAAEVVTAPQSASRVVLLRANPDDPLSRQANTLLKAELQGIGFEVTEVDLDMDLKGEAAGGELRRRIEGAATHTQSVATFAIRSVAGGTTVELWLEDHLTGKLVIRRVEVTRGQGAAADVALKAVELLRGSLLEVTVQGRAGSAPGPSTPLDIKRFVAAAAANGREYFIEGVGISAGVAALRDVGLSAASYAPIVRISWGRATGSALRLTALGLGSSPALHAAEGTAQVHQTILFADALRVLRPGARLQPFLGAGVGIHRVRSAGRGVSPLFPDGDDTTTAVAAGAAMGIAARLGNRLALVLDMALLTSLPHTRIKIALREVARTGGLTVLMGASLFGVF